MGNLREFMLKKRDTKRSSPPAGAKGNAHELAINFHELILRPVHRFQQVLQCI